MDADEHAVLRDGEVLLDEVGALLDGEAVGLERVFGRVGGGAAVRDELLLRGRRSAGAPAGDKDTAEQPAGGMPAKTSCDRARTSP